MGGGRFLAQQFPSVDGAAAYCEELNSHDPSLILYVIDEADLIVKTVLDRMYLQRSAATADRRTAAACWTVYFAVCGIALYASAPTSLAIYLTLGLAIVYGLLLAVFGARSWIEMGIVAVLLLALTVTVVRFYAQLTAASDARERARLSVTLGINGGTSGHV